MIESIMALALVLVPFVLWYIRRKLDKYDDPANQRRKRSDAAEKAVAKGDADSVNLLLESHLRRLREARGDTIGQGSPTVEGGADVHGDERRLAGAASTHAGNP